MPEAASHSGLTALFVGAHHDDIELGAGALVARLTGLGHRVLAVVMTDESDPQLAHERRQESARALQTLGVLPGAIRACGLPDGHLQVGRESVSALRAVLQTLDEPNLVVTHTPADCHNDHVATAALVAAACRRSVILGFAVPNSLLLSAFQPKFACSVDGVDARKTAALAHHRSQAALGRLDQRGLDRLHRHVGRDFGEEPAEGFDLRIQFDADASGSALRQLVLEGVLKPARVAALEAPGPALPPAHVLTNGFAEETP